MYNGKAGGDWRGCEAKKQILLCVVDVVERLESFLLLRRRDKKKRFSQPRPGRNIHRKPLGSSLHLPLGRSQDYHY